jgi:hypothetical protein
MTYLANEGADHQDDLSFDDPATVTVSIMASAAAAMPNLRWRMAVESREGLLNILVVLLPHVRVRAWPPRAGLFKPRSYNRLRQLLRPPWFVAEIL